MKAAMAAFLISLLMGLLILGEQALVMAKAHFSRAVSAACAKRTVERSMNGNAEA